MPESPRISVRVPEREYRDLQYVAAEEDKSVSEVVLSALRKALYPVSTQPDLSDTSK